MFALSNLRGHRARLLHHGEVDECGRGAAPLLIILDPRGSAQMELCIMLHGFITGTLDLTPHRPRGWANQGPGRCSDVRRNTVRSRLKEPPERPAPTGGTLRGRTGGAARDAAPPAPGEGPPAPGEGLPPVEALSPDECRFREHPFANQNPWQTHRLWSIRPI
eukprot:gene15240-10899_t